MKTNPVATDMEATSCKTQARCGTTILEYCCPSTHQYPALNFSAEKIGL